MKKFMLAFALVAGLSISANAHVTKADIQAMLTEIGTSLDKIETIYLYNTNTYYTDGSSTTFYDKYTKEKGNHCSLTDSGIKLTYKPGGVVTSAMLIAYSSILTIDIGQDYISISLYQ